MTFKPSPYQQAVYDCVAAGTESAIVEAVAGSGKTTTLVHAAGLIPQYERVAFLAFNRAIADELKRRLPQHVDAMTLNGLGHRALMRRLGRGVRLDSKKVRNLVRALLPYNDEKEYGQEVQKLVALAKAHGIAPARLSWAEGRSPDYTAVWRALIDRHDLDIPSHESDYVITLARMVLEASIRDQRVIDFDDQTYLPVIMNMPVRQFDRLFVDEAQDVSPIQRALIRRALRPGGQLIAVGDPHQAIYGFRGADSNSMEAIAEEFGARRLPLSISYRCPQNVVGFAQRIVSHIEASPAAPEGSVQCWATYDGTEFTTADMMVCRNTAPLISMAYALIGRRVPVTVMGRDIGNGLIRLIERLKPKGIEGEHGLIEKLDKWRLNEIEKYQEKDDEAGIDRVQDRHETVMTFVHESGADTVPALKDAIKSIFDAKGARMTLCTVHKAKGLEAERVFILNPDLMPAKRARQPWQLEQEYNLMYVAYTRAKDTLVFIRDKDLTTTKANQLQQKVANA